MDIGIISCVSKKLKGTHKAKDIYISDLFKKSYTYSKSKYDKVIILSAKYGVLLEDTIIEDYDLTLNNFTVKQKKIWSIKTYNQLIKIINNDDILYWHCGINYKKYLRQLLKKYRQIDNIKLPIGKLLKYYKENI